jgi:flagellar assembly factor FliW
MSVIQIQTSRFGTVEVDEKNIIAFIAPILGFEQLKQYVLLDHTENSPFKWLQAVGNPDLAFVVSNPKFFGIPYEFTLPEDAVEKLEVQQVDDVIVLTIVNIPNENPVLMTANLLAPLVVNQNNLHAMQVILQDPQLSTRTRLLPDPEEEKAGGSTAVSVEKGKG